MRLAFIIFYFLENETALPNVPHGAINLSKKPCLLVNAVLRHGKTHPKDYQPIPKPFPYDLAKVEQSLAS